jgi:tight adherence protein B
MRHRKPLVLAALVAALLAFPAIASADVRLKGVEASSYPTVRASVVTSRPSSVAPVVTENGHVVVGLEAFNLARGKSVVLAIDRSQSMKGQPLAEAVGAARAFVGAKPQNDRIAVTTFATSPVLTTSFSSNPADALGALGSIQVDPKQGTTLYDDLVLAADKLAKEPYAGRVIIIVTDGNETRSKASLEDAIDAAHKAQSAVYVVAIESPQFNPSPLKELAAKTGGRYFGASSSGGIRGMYSTIARELARTWRVEYVTAAEPGNRVRVSASVVGQGTAAGHVSIPGDNASGLPSPSKLIPESAYGPGGPLAVGLAVAMLFLVAAFLFLAAYRGSWVRTRIAAHVGETRATSKEKRRKQGLATLSAVFRATESAFGHLRQWRKVQRMLERADLPLKTVEFFWITVGGGLGLGLLTAVAGQQPLVILVAMCVAGSVPFLYVLMKMRRRLRKFEDQLPDVLITIAASLKAGHSFKQGLQAVVDEGQPPASAEFKRVLTETSLGRPMDEALEAMAERAGSKNFEFAITAVTIQRQVGGSLASLFDMVADTVRQRQQFARKIRSLTAMGRMSAYVLAGIPVFLAVAISFLNPGYMSPLFHTHTGHVLIILMVSMMAIGSALLKKIVSFKG